MQTQAWIWPSCRRPEEREARLTYQTATAPRASPQASSRRAANTNAADKSRPKVPTQKPTRPGTPDPVEHHLTRPSPSPEQKTARWNGTRRTLFHIDSAASTKQSPPGYKPIKGPNLHRQARRRRSPTHPRARRPPEAEGINAPAGGSTGRWVRPLFASLDCSRERGFERAGFSQARQTHEVKSFLPVTP